MPNSTAPDITNSPISTSLFATSEIMMSDVASFATSTALFYLTGEPQAVTPQTLIAQSRTQTAAVTNTVPPTNTPVSAAATVTFFMASPPATATISAGLTQVAMSTQTIISTSTALPTARFAPRVNYSAFNCAQREIMISWDDFAWDTRLYPLSSDIGNAVAYLSLLGSDGIISQVNIHPNGDPTILELSDPSLDRSYFLQVKHPTFLFQPMIIQFTSDCAYNQLTITYRGQSDIIDPSTLQVDFSLIDWGPNSLDTSFSWIAKLSIKQDQTGIFTYNRNQLSEQTFYVRGVHCSSGAFTVGRTSNGKYQEVVLSLYIAGPLCPKTG
jgi:hypothetical protein